MVAAVRQLFSFFLNHSTHPPSWDVVPAAPLFKSGDRSNPMNYRIIAFLPALCKCFDACLATRLSKWAKDKGLLSDTQYGYRPQTETADLWYTYKHTLTARTKAGMKTYVASLDVKKAFPSVPRYRIWNHCFDKGLGGRFMLSLINMSESARIWLMVPQALPTHSFPLERGVREGSPMSPILFIIYADAVLVLLRSKRIGVFFKGVYTGASMFADDLSLIMRSLEELNSALDLLSSHALISRTTYNASKTTILVFGESPTYYATVALWPHLAPTINMGGSPITPVSNLKLLGLRSDDHISFADQLRHITSLCPMQANDLARAGVVRNGLNVKSAITMWKALYVPFFSYCIQIWFDDKMTNVLDPFLSRPILHSFAHPDRFFDSHSHILNLEFHLPSISHLYRQSLMSHEHRLRHKPEHNPAARLNFILRQYNHPHCRNARD